MAVSGWITPTQGSGDAVLGWSWIQAGLVCVALVFFVSTDGREKGETLPSPPNISLSWKDDFSLLLSWEPPPPPHCQYLIQMKQFNVTFEAPDVNYTDDSTMDGGSASYTCQTICGNRSSAIAVYTISYPELVKNVQCFLNSSQLSYCSWSPSRHSHGLRSFFLEINKANVLVNRARSQHECIDYKFNDGLKTGCVLRGDYSLYSVYLMFNGTVNNTLARNTFKRTLSDNVRPPSLNWTVAVVNEMLTISCIPPDVLLPHCWSYEIRYHKCNEIKVEKIQSGHCLKELGYEPHCRYRIYMRAYVNECGSGGIPWSEAKEVGEDKNPYTSIYIIAVIVPVTCVTLAIIALVCFRKHKEKIIPNIPCPSESVKNMLDNNNMSNIRDLYIPPKEEDDVTVTLVTDISSKMDTTEREREIEKETTISI